MTQVVGQVDDGRQAGLGDLIGHPGADVTFRPTPLPAAEELAAEIGLYRIALDER